MARKVYYYRKAKSELRRVQTEEVNRPPTKRRLTLEDDVSSSDSDEGTGPNLLPAVGVFARASTSGVPKKVAKKAPGTSEKPKGEDGSAAANEPQSSSPESKKPRAGPSGVPSRPTPQGKKPNTCAHV